MRESHLYFISFVPRIACYIGFLFTTRYDAIEHTYQSHTYLPYHSYNRLELHNVCR